MKTNEIIIAMYDRYKIGQGMSQKEIADAIGSTRTNVSAALSTLRMMELVRVERGYPPSDPNHRVIVNIYTLTEDGVKLSEILDKRRQLYVR